MNLYANSCKKYFESQSITFKKYNQSKNRVTLTKPCKI